MASVEAGATLADTVDKVEMDNVVRRPPPEEQRLSQMDDAELVAMRRLTTSSNSCLISTGPQTKPAKPLDRLDRSFRVVSLSGLSEYARSNTAYGKAFWISLIVLAVLATIFGAYKLVVNFYNCPIVTEYKVTVTDKMDFPKVQVCLPVSFHRKHLEERPWLVEVVSVMRQSVVMTQTQTQKLRGSDVGERKQRFPGQGLLLLLNAQLENYPTEKKVRPKTEGVLIMIDNDYNLYNFDFLNIQPSLYTRLSLSKEHHQYLNVPSGPKVQPCMEEADVDLKVLNHSYSVTACRTDCFLHAIVKHCDCVLAQDPRFLKKEVLASTRFCTSKDVEGCIRPKVTDSDDNQDLQQCTERCHLPCDRWKFIVQATSMKLHRPSFDFLHKVNVSFESLVYLQIAYSDLTYTSVSQEWAMEVDNFIADLGGEIGLWTGASMITFIHIPVMLLALGIAYLSDRMSGFRKLSKVLNQKSTLWTTVLSVRK
ncbi:unnamed protein product [Soboliphyme baturini]|uniref:Amiloride-sensitive sodium channel n=1 Tax=Soboliphyme baturini TaxID=241478 RepID=A0A183J7F5_9BILA|nr:unnamed protein product [Soboliphyme baturini]